MKLYAKVAHKYSGNLNKLKKCFPVYFDIMVFVLYTKVYRIAFQFHIFPIFFAACTYHKYKNTVGNEECLECAYTLGYGTSTMAATQCECQNGQCTGGKFVISKHVYSKSFVSVTFCWRNTGKVWLLIHNFIHVCFPERHISKIVVEYKSN